MDVLGEFTRIGKQDKVDLTKYVEKHKFVFDEAFNESSTNEDVSVFF